MTGLTPVANVSWPRSGHGLLVRMLRATLGEGFGYCEFYGPRRQPGSGCCDAFPCRRPGIHMSKQHDAFGRAELPPGWPLVVQSRAFLPSVVSHYEYALARNEVADTAAGFRAFAEGRLAPWQRFRAKWIETPREPRVVLRYEALTADPVAALAPVLALLGAADVAADPGALARLHGITFVAGARTVARRAGIHAARDPEAFRHHDAALFAYLAAAAA